MRSVPPGNTSLSRRTLSGSFGRLGTSTSRPKPLKTPLATTVLSTTVREPDVPDATILTLNDSWPEVRAGPDAAAAAAGRTSPTTTSDARRAAVAGLIPTPFVVGWHRLAGRRRAPRAATSTKA